MKCIYNRNNYKIIKQSKINKKMNHLKFVIQIILKF